MRWYIAISTFILLCLIAVDARKGKGHRLGDMSHGVTVNQDVAPQLPEEDEDVAEGLPLRRPNGNRGDKKDRHYRPNNPGRPHRGDGGRRDEDTVEEDHTPDFDVQPTENDLGEMMEHTQMVEENQEDEQMTMNGERRGASRSNRTHGPDDMSHGVTSHEDTDVVEERPLRRPKWNRGGKKDRHDRPDKPGRKPWRFHGGRRDEDEEDQAPDFDVQPTENDFGGTTEHTPLVDENQDDEHIITRDGERRWATRGNRTYGENRGGHKERPDRPTRNRTRDMQRERPNRPDRPERPERPQHTRNGERPHGRPDRLHNVNRPDIEERFATCEWGDWTDWSECAQGVRARTREVISGNPRCAKKAREVENCQVTEQS